MPAAGSKPVALPLCEVGRMGSRPHSATWQASVEDGHWSSANLGMELDPFSFCGHNATVLVSPVKPRTSRDGHPCHTLAL